MNIHAGLEDAEYARVRARARFTWLVQLVKVLINGKYRRCSLKSDETVIFITRILPLPPGENHFEYFTSNFCGRDSFHWDSS